MAARLKNLGWIEPLPINLIPNYVEPRPAVPQPRLGPRARTFTCRGRPGYTGFAYNPSVTGRELTSVNDLFDAECKGKVGMFTEMRDTLGLTMLGLGLDPSTADEDGDEPGARQDRRRRPTAGQIRRFTGNDYLQDIENGNFAACMAWSGDIAQSTNPDVKFVYPRGGRR